MHDIERRKKFMWIFLRLAQIPLGRTEIELFGPG
jgi:hypothetical protein